MAEFPLPDLDQRPLPTSIVPVGTTLFRMVRSRHGPAGALHFSSSKNPRQRSRWYAPDASYGVAFYGLVVRVCFLETLLRNPHQKLVTEAELGGWTLVELHVKSDLRVVDLEGANLRKVGCTAATVSGPHMDTWPFSGAFHDHPDEPAGIMHASRMDPDDSALALFDRAKDDLEVTSSVTLLDAAFEVTLSEILDRYDIGLV